MSAKLVKRVFDSGLASTYRQSVWQGPLAVNSVVGQDIVGGFVVSELPDSRSNGNAARHSTFTFFARRGVVETLAGATGNPSVGTGKKAVRDYRDNVIEALADSENQLARTVAAFREELSVALQLLHDEHVDNGRLCSQLREARARIRTDRHVA